MAPKCVVFPILLTLLSVASLSKAELNSDYYDQTCPELEKIVSDTVLNATKFDPKVPARILRMFFHDCFIRVLYKFILWDLDSILLRHILNIKPS